jgi:hypothetical protein
MSQLSGIGEGSAFENKKQTYQVSAKEFSAKYKSKKECYNFLTVTAKAYLSSHETVTTYFLKSLINGEKQCKYSQPFLTLRADIKCNRLKVFFVP